MTSELGLSTASSHAESSDHTIQAAHDAYNHKISAVVNDFSLRLPPDEIWSKPDFEELRDVLSKPEQPESPIALLAVSTEQQMRDTLKTYAYRWGIYLAAAGLHEEGDPFTIFQSASLHHTFFIEQAKDFGRNIYSRLENDALAFGFFTEEIPEAVFVR
jgi:hypothetical protein